MQVDAAIRLPRNRRPHSITNTQNSAAKRLGMAQRGERVGGFTRLRNDHDNVLLGAEHDSAVPEL